MLFPFGADAVQPLREAAFLCEGRHLSLDLPIQQRASHSDEDQR
ncbi:MAG: hypothetical protein RLZZ253_3120, partial [Verrucomicrobiota bacterium]